MKIAGVQTDVLFGDVSGNLDRVDSKTREARRNGAELVIFPECSLTGYCYESLEEAEEIAQTVPGPATETLASLCRELGCSVIVGLIERAPQGVWNTAVLIGPDGQIVSYRKTHLPFIGVDKVANYGDELVKIGTVGDFRVGLNICYDATLPEPPRCLALAGADLIALPTNWPQGAECLPAHVANIRAMENGVYFAAVNRVGVERGCPFIGGSRICNPYGKTLASADETEETILYADIDLDLARRKTASREPGVISLHRKADRRPELYDALTLPHGMTPPGRTANN
ncbi:carbon-nitrogen hydrolase family protein [Thalassoroseus pseudoceratinae]|uniref:carbon-nitrogen hydrolase family protein n=1 Tax=Thalassoroseus pseudoceratinae TaxID=2713176 RepID=UPI00141DA2A8|nr:carbon-nitrogen hydrolase family protein [Thalassoroseus pseudoceratinae]